MVADLTRWLLGSDRGHDQSVPVADTHRVPDADGERFGLAIGLRVRAPCADTDIAVSVTTAQQSYPVGGPAEFVMKIANTGTQACVRDVGPAANTFTVTSGGFDVWSSDACTDPGESQEEEIPAGEAFAVKGTWDATVTANGCGANATPAQAGAYQVEARNGNVTSEAVTFSLS